MPTVRAQLRHMPVAPRKVRSVARVIKGMDVDKARFQLQNIARRSSPALLKLLNSTIANALNNFSMLEDNLFVKDVIVNEGIKLVRYMPKARGSAGMIQKKRSHIIIVLDEKIPGLKGKKKEKEDIKAADIHEGEVGEPHGGAVAATREKTIPKPEKKASKGMLGGVRKMSRKIFQPRINRGSDSK